MDFISILILALMAVSIYLIWSIISERLKNPFKK